VVYIDISEKSEYSLTSPSLSENSVEWLSAWFRILELGEVTKASPEIWVESSRQGQEKAFSNFFGHALLMLLQISRVPAFVLPTVASAKPLETDTSPTLSFLVEKLDNYPPQLYKVALGAAKSLAVWAASNEPSEENAELLFKILMEREVPSIQRFSAGGKSTVPVLRAAHELEIPTLHLGLGVFQLGWGSQAKRIDRSITEYDSVIGLRLASNKFSTANLLRLAGLPAPDHEVVVRDQEALEAAKKLGYPVVIKPLDLDRGEGVEVDIEDDSSLLAAFQKAQKLSPSRQVIVEKQVPGVCHRVFVVDGKLLYSVKRNSMSVIGDGEKSIEDLVKAEVAIQSSRPPWKRTEIQPLDTLALKSLATQGFSPESIPEAKQLVGLRRIESTEWGGVDQEVTDTIHPANQEIAIAATKLFNLYVAGVDIITGDISKPWTQTGAIINEVNIGPLFGGGEISRSHIPTFLKHFVPGGGRIPIFEEANRQQALDRQAELTSSGSRCYLTSATETLNPEGEHLLHSLEGSAKRLKALFCRADVDSVVLVQDDLSLPPIPPTSVK
jgi:cyanophycin synthetase